MITDAILSVLANLARLLLGLLPDVTLPGWVQNIGPMGAEVFAVADSLSVWFPWATIMTVVSAVFGCAVIGFGIKVTRMVISHVTGGGGSAA